MSIITLVWSDGSEEDVVCHDWHWNLEGVLVICTNPTTREYRYIMREKIRELRTKR